MKKERVFHSRKCSIQFYQSHIQSALESNEQMMKTKLRTFARKQILREPIKKLVEK